jgi:cob(I)alamin adenosyltransferase
MTSEQGQIHVYTGDGKGKTTAALGLALRAAGHGLRVEVIQFMKGWPGYGELEAVRWLPTVTIHPWGRAGWVHPDQPEEEDYELASQALSYARERMLSGEVDLAVLDEVNVALDYGLVSLEALLEVLDEKPGSVTLVLTGRNAHAEVLRRADLVTEMRKIKHPYDRGVKACRGLEF